MRRATTVLPVEKVDRTRVIDHVLLDADDRHRRRHVLDGESGTRFLLDLAEPAVLREGDGLALEDGSIVEVRGKPEPVLEIAATSATELARFAWHLGNRHTEIEVRDGALRIRFDHVLEGMLVGLGAAVKRLDAPFEPERGAYASSGHHHHDHGHHHGGHRYGDAHAHDHRHE